MPSICTKRAILQRLEKKCCSEEFSKCDTEEEMIRFLEKYMEYEYDLIPQKERMRKGSVFIAKCIGEACLTKLQNEKKFEIFSFADKLISCGEREKTRNLYNLGVILLGYHMSSSLQDLCKGFEILPKYVDHPNWEIREMSCFCIRECIKNFRQETISYLQPWVRSENSNIRRLVSESLRPLNDMKWLRDPEENDFLLRFLHELRADPSEYVRKSVGNNLKDLSKYIPVIILDLLSAWIKEARIEVNAGLASMNKTKLGERNYYLIWTMKHALRWVRERNPEYHIRIQGILGENYLLYYNEKHNKLALPRKT